MPESSEKRNPRRDYSYYRRWFATQSALIARALSKRLENLRLNSPRLLLVLVAFAWLLATALGAYLVFYLLVWGGAFGKLPERAALANIESPLASEVYAADGVLLGKYFLENRTQIERGGLPNHLLDALVATEDARFYQHAGVDYRSMTRVLFKSILLNQAGSGGGSTLSQQLAKNLYPRKNHGILSMPVNKLREAIIARRLEKLYSKEQILVLYLNTVSFGENAYGIETASQRFFSKKPQELTIEEAALLVGMLKATTAYNPRRNPENARERRNVVLSQMHRYGYLNKSALDSLQSLPVALLYRRYHPSMGLAPYFRTYLQEKVLKPLLQRPDLRKPDGSAYNLFTDGLRIYTTLDSRMQEIAERAVLSHMASKQRDFYRHWSRSKPWNDDMAIVEDAVKRSPRFQRLKAANVSQPEIDSIFQFPVSMKIFTLRGEVDTVLSPLDSILHYAMFLNAGFLVIEPENGAVRSWVGGIDHQYFQFDHVTAHRQVGSTFKPFVYAAALERDRDPCVYISRAQEKYPQYDGWEPGNSGGGYEGLNSMAGGLVNSVNTVTVKLIMETGTAPVIRLARKLGIDSELPTGPAIALGAADLTLMEMVTAYAGLANGGQAVEPLALLRVEDRAGNVLYKASEVAPGKSVISERTLRLLTRFMERVVNEGTGSRLRSTYGVKGPIAGKTGTTQNQSDGWFIGFTPELVAGAWVGADDRRVHFRNLRHGQGAAMALPIWGKFFRELQRDTTFGAYQGGKFPGLNEELLAEIDCPDFKEDTLQDLDMNFWQQWWQRQILQRQADEAQQEADRRRRIYEQEERKRRGVLNRLFKRNRRN